jgi:Putative prokaryotic signal transducing protein
VYPAKAYNWFMDIRKASELVTIRQFGNMSEALLAKGCLESAGIECFLADANITRLEWPLSRGMRLQVNADDAETARAFLETVASDSNA